MAKKRKKPAEDQPQEGQGAAPSGEAFGDDHHARATARLIGRAIREGWPVSEATRQKVVAEMEKMLKAKAYRWKLGAAKVLIAADSVNAKREDTAAPKRLEVSMDEMSDEELLRIAKGGEG